MKRRYRFGMDYVRNWTVMEVIKAGYTIIVKGKK